MFGKDPLTSLPKNLKIGEPVSLGWTLVLREKTISDSCNLFMLADLFKRCFRLPTERSTPACDDGLYALLCSTRILILAHSSSKLFLKTGPLSATMVMGKPKFALHSFSFNRACSVDLLFVFYTCINPDIWQHKTTKSLPLSAKSIMNPTAWKKVFKKHVMSTSFGFWALEILLSYMLCTVYNGHLTQPSFWPVLFSTCWSNVTYSKSWPPISATFSTKGSFISSCAMFTSCRSIQYI